MKLAWEYFRSWASRVDANGHKLIVPVLGAGFNAQAGVAMGWAELLREVQKRHDLHTDLPDNLGIVGNSTLAWEAMVLDLARLRGESPHKSESTLLASAVEVLRDRYRPVGAPADFARRFLEYSFTDILSFNFDELLHVDGPTFWTASPDGVQTLSQRTPLAGEFSRTRTFVEHGDGTRVWYPNGSVRSPESLRLGMRNYGTAIRELETEREAAKAQERKIRDRLYPDGAARALAADERETLWATQRAHAWSWVSVCLNAPLVFIGMSLGREEWPLWWFLNQRARNFARRGIERPTFVFMRRDEADRLRVAGELNDLVLLTFDSYDRGWDRLLDALAGFGDTVAGARPALAP